MPHGQSCKGFLGHASEKSKVFTLNSLPLEIKNGIVAINNDWSHKFKDWRNRLKIVTERKRGFTSGLRINDERESVAAVLRLLTEQGKTKGFVKINRR